MDQGIKDSIYGLMDHGAMGFGPWMNPCGSDRLDLISASFNLGVCIHVVTSSRRRFANVRNQVTVTSNRPQTAAPNFHFGYFHFIQLLIFNLLRIFVGIFAIVVNW